MYAYEETLIYITKCQESPSKQGATFNQYSENVRDEIKMYHQKVPHLLRICVKMEAYRYQSSCSKNRYW